MTQTAALKNKKNTLSQGTFVQNTTKTANSGGNVYLTYYGARYLDPKTSRWLSSDPALGEYIPLAPLGENEKKHNSNLPGMGGVYNLVNLHVYHYAGNNPVKYVDPDGEKIISFYAHYNMSNYTNTKLGNSSTEKISQSGCYITTYANIGFSMLLGRYDSFVNYGSKVKASLTGINNLTNIFQTKSAYLVSNTVVMNTIFGEGRWESYTKAGQANNGGLLNKLKELDASGQEYMIAAIFELSVYDKATDSYKNITHMVGITGLPGEDGVFDPSSIVPTSRGDRNRLTDPKQRLQYNLNNLREFTAISVDSL